MSSPHVDGVLDLTFMDIRDETDLERCFNDKLSELNNAISSPKNSLDMKNTSKISPEDFKAVRLSYNNIASLDVVIALTRFLDPQKIYWFDLSYNNISTISDNFINAFPNIKTLYLQANKIKRLSEIKKLSRLTKLRSLCLFGNPIEEYKHYRNYVYYTCQSLTQFDMSPKTRSEVQKMEVWSQTFRKKLHPDSDDI